MGRLADKVNGFCNKPKASTVKKKTVFGGCLRMDHHRHIYIVKLAKSYKLLLSAKEAYFTRLNKLFTIAYLHILLSRGCEKANISVKLILYSRKSDSRANHCRNLPIVTAGMGCAAYRIGGRVAS